MLHSTPNPIRFLDFETNSEKSFSNSPSSVFHTPRNSLFHRNIARLDKDLLVELHTGTFSKWVCYKQKHNSCTSRNITAVCVTCGIVPPLALQHDCRTSIGTHQMIGHNGGVSTSAPKNCCFVSSYVVVNAFVCACILCVCVPAEAE